MMEHSAQARGCSASVTCVVVTRDRQELLRECLSAVAAQTHRPTRVVVVDNASSDGTSAMVRTEFSDVQFLALGRNVGSAGGFHAGLTAASDAGTHWFWLLDDDSIAEPDALQRLIEAPWPEAGLPEPLLLASRVNWTDGTPHPMNTPMLRRRDPNRLVQAVESGLLPLRATTFVSLLVAAAAVERLGPPRPEFFLQADDIEFTARLLRSSYGYLVPDSIVEHRTKTPHTFLIDPFKFYFHLRNTLFMIKGDSWSNAEKLALAWVVIDSTVRFITQHGLNTSSIRTVTRALRDGLRGSTKD